MIVEYHRPQTIESALALLARPDPPTRPLGGGSALVRPGLEPLAVVDLQALGLDAVQVQGSLLLLGAALKLQALLDWTEETAATSAGDLGVVLRRVILHEATHNLRQAATVAGTLVAAGGRSPFAAALVALDAALTLQPGDESISLGDLLPVRDERLSHRLITAVSLPLNARLAYEYVARTPADRPLVCAAVARWPSGRVRIALGGFGAAPCLVFDGAETAGAEPAGAETAAASAYSAAADDWASAEYRSDMAAVLVERCLKNI